VGFTFGFASPVFGQKAERIAPLLEGLGDNHYSISTDSREAQRYFDQGLILAYGFNHAEAERSFREAARLDPDCAMCYWGIALVLGPNINAAMGAESAPKAYEAIQKALELAPQATKKERDFIEALAKRYAATPVEDRKTLDVAYADAMREVKRRFPEDLDGATLFVEALMDLHPWDYWTEEGKPQPWTPEILSNLESVLERAPNHPLAIHLYIHAVEASDKPQRGEPYADRLRNLVPGAGHLVHMPSHIYIRIGRYHDASVANERAIQSDQSYITQCHAQGIYPLAYMPHNDHFLWYSAMMEGRSAVSIRAARDTASKSDPQMMRDPLWAPLMQHFYLIPLYGLTRFGKWDEILKESNPAADLPYPTGVWHYARGMAFVGKGRLEEAAQELERLRVSATDPSLKAMRIWGINTPASLLQIASEVLAGELAAKQGDYERAIVHLETAVDMEDRLIYIEPPNWHYPVQHSLGAVLLEAGRPAAAEKVYREDLRKNPENGWSLFGLAQSLRSRGQTDEAVQVEQRFEKAWAWADVKLKSSRF
jgi:tetratricopeptide (TPR) repeat protein